MSDDEPAREPIEEDARIDALEKRLAAARQREDERNRPKASGADANYRSGNRVLADLLGGLLGGALPLGVARALTAPRRLSHCAHVARAPLPSAASPLLPPPHNYH